MVETMGLDPQPPACKLALWRSRLFAIADLSLKRAAEVRDRTFRSGS